MWKQNNILKSNKPEKYKSKKKNDKNFYLQLCWKIQIKMKTFFSFKSLNLIFKRRKSFEEILKKTFGDKISIYSSEKFNTRKIFKYCI